MWTIRWLCFALFRIRHAAAAHTQVRKSHRLVSDCEQWRESEQRVNEKYLSPNKASDERLRTPHARSKSAPLSSSRNRPGLDPQPVNVSNWASDHPVTHTPYLCPRQGRKTLKSYCHDKGSIFIFCRSLARSLSQTLIK